MVYHVLVYGNEGVYRGNDFLLHAFIRDKSKVPEVLELTRRLLVKYGIRQPNIRYYGVEKLSLSDVGEGWFFFISKKDEWGSYRLSLVEKGGSVDLSAIEKIKMWRLTIDYDYPDAVTTAVRVVEELAKLSVVRDYIILRTPRGFHVRARLTRPMSLDEKFEIRARLLDDWRRIEYDRELVRLGFPALADTLFNEKCWSEDGTSWTCYAEKEMLIDSIDLRALGIDLSVRQLELPDLTLRDGMLRFRTPKTPQEAVKIISDLRENAAKYLGLHYLANSKSLTEAVIRAYCDYASWEVCEVLRHSRIVEGSGRYIVIEVPDNFSEFVGMMIGKGGSLIKYIEQLLNVKIKILAREPEHVTLKKKMRSLMKNLTT